VKAMKIEFLESDSTDCPLIRIYGDEPDFCAQLLHVFEQLATGKVKEVSLTELPGVEPIGNCILIAQVYKRDRGVVRKGGNSFFWMQP
jgi:hypothetical protein